MKHSPLFLFALTSAFVCPMAHGAPEALIFHGPTSIEAVELGTAMSALATQTIDQFDEHGPNNEKNYADSMFRLQLVAGKYVEAIGTIQTLRKRRDAAEQRSNDLLYLQYQVYAQAKAFQRSEERSFSDAFAQAFREAFSPLDDSTALRGQRSFGANVARMRAEAEKALSSVTPGRSLTVDAAMELIRSYQVFSIYHEMLAEVPALLAEDDGRRYLIDTDALIITPTDAHIAAMVVRAKSLTGKLPTLLGFTIYANDEWSLADAKKMAAHGYVGVVAYTRGKGRSSDKAIPYENDGEDASAVIDWISRQPWSDGRVGMYGGSYNGFTQWAAAKHHPTALKAMATSATTAPGIDVPMQGGVFMNFVYPYPFYTTNTRLLDDPTYNDQKRWDALNRNWYRSGKPYSELSEIDGTPNPIFERWLQHPDYDAYWQRMIPYQVEFANIDIPVLTTTGYFDGAQVGALYYFNEHTRYRPNADHTLVVGPYEHLTMQFGVARWVQGYVVDPAAILDLQELRLQWFDHIFKNAPKPELLKDRVNYQVMGRNTWKHATTLDEMANTSLRFYLSSNRDGDAYHLTNQAQTSSSFVSQRIDFRDRSDADWTESELVINKTLDSHNGITFIGDPLAEAKEVSGTLSGQLDFVANKRDLDLTATIYELTAGGDYVELLSYMGRASYAKDRGHRQLLTPGQRAIWKFQSEHLTSRVVVVGSRLVLVLSVNKRPDMQINYGSGKDVSEESIADADEPLQLQWYNSSYIDLPVWQ